MNNTYFIPLIRRDSAVQLTVHLAAGILALVLLTGLARPERSVSDTGAPAAPAADVVHR